MSCLGREDEGLHSQRSAANRHLNRRQVLSRSLLLKNDRKVGGCRLAHFQSVASAGDKTVAVNRICRSCAVRGLTACAANLFQNLLGIDKLHVGHHVEIGIIIGFV